MKNQQNKKLLSFPAALTAGNTQRAFTLIELLVVVLIIGLLSAVALPQYEKAVEKARFSTYRALADGLAKSAKNYYLTNGTWPNKLDGFEVTLPADMTFTACSDRACCYANDKTYCCIIDPLDPGYGGAIHCGDKQSNLVYNRAYASDKGTPKDGYSCIAKNQENYKAICKAISGGQTPRSTYVTKATGGWQSGHFVYDLN